MWRTLERALEDLAETQFGVVSRSQALALGLSEDMIDNRVKSGRLRLLHPCTYAIAGSPSSWYRDVIAACLWSGGAASHRAAGRLWELPNCDEDVIEIVTSDLQVVPRSGIRVHHTQRLTEEQRTTIDSIPVTSVERTLLDLGAVFRRDRVAIAVDDALRRGLTTLGDLDYCLFRTARRGRRGCAVLRDVVRRRDAVKERPHSPLESLIFELLSRSSLPLPQPQYEIKDAAGTFVARVDFAFPEFKLVIEGHSRKWHLADEAAFRDARRHNELTSLGYRVLYVTWADVVNQPEATLLRVERALRESGWNGVRAESAVRY